MAMPKPTCRICNRQMTYSKDADWDAAYWICETEHTRNGIGISTAIAHEDAQVAYIAQLEAENTALRQQLAAITPAQAGKLVIEWHEPTAADALDVMLDEAFGNTKDNELLPAWSKTTAGKGLLSEKTYKNSAGE